uniref:Uncharacterized protein n=1 Tax=Janibacter limosus TaxID=53458 RepID=A0AC61U8D1_9MICO|nr:hypothetical protein [Janibacter limosus]
MTNDDETPRQSSPSTPFILRQPSIEDGGEMWRVAGGLADTRPQFFLCLPAVGT